MLTDKNVILMAKKDNLIDPVHPIEMSGYGHSYTLPCAYDAGEPTWAWVPGWGVGYPDCGG